MESAEREENYPPKSDDRSSEVNMVSIILTGVQVGSSVLEFLHTDFECFLAS